MLNVVVVGRGFIGKAVADFLSQKEVSVTRLAHFEVYDLRSMKQVDVIINCAGIVRCEDWKIVDSHESFPGVLLNASQGHNPLIIQCSSEHVYGWVTHPTLPCGVTGGLYGKSKLAAERLLDARVPEGKLCVLRLSNVFGSTARPDYCSVIAKWIDLAMHGQPLHVSRGSRRDFVPIEAVCETMWSLICMDDVSAYRFVDVGAGYAVDISLVASIIASYFGVEIVLNDDGCTIPANRLEGVCAAASARGHQLFELKYDLCGQLIKVMDEVKARA